MPQATERGGVSSTKLVVRATDLARVQPTLFQKSLIAYAWHGHCPHGNDCEPFIRRVQEDTMMKTVPRAGFPGALLGLNIAPAARAQARRADVELVRHAPPPRRCA